GFGDQWNFALNELPVEAPWTMKLDPDERLDEGLKESLKAQMLDGKWQGITVDRHLWFMGRVLPIQQRILRAWQTGACRFSDVAVNEHPLVDGSIGSAAGILRHHDSPDLDHWLEKQNRYTSAEAVMSFQNAALSVAPRLFGDSMQRRMWLKKHFSKLPGRFFWLFLYYWLIRGTWRAGWVGYAWARLRTDVMRLREYKRREIELTGNLPTTRHYGTGSPDKRVQQFD
ncbi:MAG: glycosyltransferase family 2 protein, partial [Pseudomonadota bacterium]